MIELGKNYRTVSGLPVRIYAVDGGGWYPVHGASYNSENNEWESRTWSLDGIYSLSYGEQHPFELIEILPWEDFKIDEPVVVWDDPDGRTYLGHFAGIRDSKPAIWDNWGTSFTASSKNSTIVWNHCRRPTQEELERNL